MAMDVSRLGIIVESTGIVEARNALAGSNGRGGLALAAEKAEKSVNSLTASMAKLMNTNATATGSAWASAFNGMNSSVASLLGNLNSVTAALSGLNANINGSIRVVNSKTEAVRGYNRESHVMLNTIKAMTTAFSVYQALAVAKSIVEQSDAWAMMQGRLQNAVGSMHNAKVAQEQLFDMSQKLGTSLDANVRLYTRMAPAMQRLGKNSEETRGAVERIAMALRIAGANGAEASSVMTQLSQSFSSGVVNGAEFVAMAENGGRIMRALMDYTGKSQYELKKLGSEGKLAVQTLNDALTKAGPELEKEFKNLPVTFEISIQRIKNQWLKSIGEMGSDTGFTKELGSALKIIEDMVPLVVQGLGNAFKSMIVWVAQNKDTLIEIWDQVVGIGKDIWVAVRGVFGFLGYLISAKDEVSFIGAALFSVRLLFAGLQDGAKVLAGLLGLVGNRLIELMLKPVQWIVTGFSYLISGFEKLLSLASKGADVLGMEGLSEQLAGMATMASKSAQKMENFSNGITLGVEAQADAAKAMIMSVGGADGAVQTLLNSTKEYNKEAAKSKGVMNESEFGTGKAPPPRIDAKAASAAATELKRFQDGLAAAKAMLEQQLELTKRLKEYGAEYEKLGPAQRKVIEMTEQIKKLESQKASAVAINHATQIKNVYELAAAQERINSSLKEEAELRKRTIDSVVNKTKAIADEAAKAEAKVASLGGAKGLSDYEVLKNIEAELYQARANRARLTAEATESEVRDSERLIAEYQKQVEAQSRLAAANTVIGNAATVAEFDKLMDPSRAKDFTSALTEGFDNSGKAIGNAIKALDKWQNSLTKQRKAQELADKATNPRDKARLQQEYNDLVTKDTISSFADMAGAAKGFFKEHSRGYAAMEAVEKGFRLWQMAIQVQSFLQEMGFIAKATTAVIAADSTKTASGAAAASADAASSLVAGTAAAATGVAKQATGDPYTAFARMAAMAALMASIGFAVGGSKASVDVSKARQEAQGTGTVFGDSKAKSESIKNSMEILARNSDVALRYSSGMLAALQNIEASLGGATSGVIRSGSVTGSGFQGSSSGMSTIQATILTGVGGPIVRAIDKALGGVVSKVLGIGTKTSLQDSGLLGRSQSVGDILSSGFGVQGYQDIQTVKKAIGIKYSDKTRTELSAIDPAISREFGNVIQSVVEGLTSAASALGLSGDAVKAKLSQVNVDIGKISLKGLNGEQIQEQLSAVFGAIPDRLTETALGVVKEFQKAGEGLFETAVRVANGVEVAGFELEKLGITAIAFSDVVNKTGDIAAEIVRQSVLSAERSAGIAEIIGTFSGNATEIAQTYSSLVDVRRSLIGLRIASDVSREIIKAAGGLDELSSSLQSYRENFFSEDEQRRMGIADLAAEFRKLGVAMPASREAFRALVTSLSAGGIGSQQLAVKVIGLSESFSQLYEAVGGAEAITVADARSDLTDAYDRETESLKSVKERFEGFADSLKTFRDNLLTGDLSILSGVEKYAVEKARFEEILTQAKGGSEEALSKFSEVADSFLKSSREINASGEIYTSDFNRVLAETSALQGTTGSKASEADKQLAALDKQVSGLLEVNKSVLTVTEAVKVLTDLIAGKSAAGADVGFIEEQINKKIPIVDNEDSPGVKARSYTDGGDLLNSGMTIDYSGYGTSSNVALVEEIRALRTEVTALREGQREQTGQLIAASYEVNEMNATQIVEGQKDINSTNNYKERTRVNLV